MSIRSFDSASEVLAVLDGPLNAAGAEGELTLGILGRLVDEPAAWGAEVTMLVELDGERPVAVLTRTGPHPALIVGFDEPDAIGHQALADALLATGRRVADVNGPRRFSEPFAAVVSQLTGVTPRVHRQTRAYELRAVRMPALPRGRFRLAVEEDAPTLRPWIEAFGRDIGETITAEEAGARTDRLIPARELVVWEDDGQIVSMAAVVRRTRSSAHVALVYTPPSHRGRGYASAAVALLSQRELDAGNEWCSLYTDLANPTSNHIYAAIGYEPICDFRQFRFVG
jgi:predicted GNAT family acetyltransferase